MELGFWRGSVAGSFKLSESVLGVMGRLALCWIGSQCADTGGCNASSEKKARSWVSISRIRLTSAKADIASLYGAADAYFGTRERYPQSNCETRRHGAIQGENTRRNIAL